MKRLTLSRSLTSSRRFVSREFTNRDSLLDRVNVEVRKVRSASTYFRVFSFYGIGGIGKTSLLKQLFLRNRSPDLSWVAVDLESGAVQTTTDVLYEIYRSSGVRYFPFEYTLALIWERRGLSIHDIRNRLVAVSVGWSDFGDAALEAMSAGVNLPAVLRLSDKLADALRKRHHDAEIRAIDSSTDSERERLLPGLLARAIKIEANKKGRSLVVAVDSLDSLAQKPGFGEGGEPADNWLQELLAQTQCGVWLLAGREKLRWHEDLPDWNEAMEQHLMGVLSIEDSEKFLRGVEITEPRIVRAIVETSRGVPMALDLATSFYLAKREDGAEPEPEDFRDTADGMLRKYLSHLDKNHADAIRCLALIDEFNYEAAAAALGAWSLPITLADYRTLCGSIMALRLEGGTAEYRIHRLLRDPVARSVPPADKARVLKALVSLAAHLREEGLEAGSWAFARCLVFIREHAVGVGRDASELFLTGYRLMEAGGYGSLGALLAATADERSLTHGGAESLAAVDALLAYLHRRTGRLDDASRAWTSLGEQVSLNRDAAGIIRYLSAHTEHLLGHYTEASRVYEKIVDQPQDHGAAHYPYAVRQLGDIRMLEGEFGQALTLLEKSRGLRSDDAWEAEVLRHIGHVFRHNYLLDAAKEKYDAADDMARMSASPMLRARLRTNYVELHAWRQPEFALAQLAGALEANREFENEIEVGKCLAAGGVANALLGRCDDGQRLAREALKVQLSTGYLSGQLFALCALALNQCRLGSYAAVDATRREIMGIEQRVGVYRYYRSVLDYCFDEERRRGVDGLARWLDYRESRRVLDEVAATMRGSSTS